MMARKTSGVAHRHSSGSECRLHLQSGVFWRRPVSLQVKHFYFVRQTSFQLFLGARDVEMKPAVANH